MNEARIENVYEVVTVFAGKVMSFLPLNSLERREIKINSVRVWSWDCLIFESDKCWVGYSHPNKKFSIIEKGGEEEVTGEVISGVMVDGIPFSNFLTHALKCCTYVPAK